MRINFEKLRDAGFHVEVDSAGVDVMGMQEFPFSKARDFLIQFGLTDSQMDQTLGDLSVTVELHQIFNALR